ncbi:MAG: hypothetical protein V3T22_03020 [Planctomycetota bacterium]
MANHHLDSQIRACINSFVDELSTLVKQAAVESVREALEGPSTPARRGPGRPRKATAVISRPKKRRKRRSSGAVDSAAKRILAQIQANPGQGVGQIGASLRLTSKDLRLPILKLLEDKKIKTTGQRRGTKYFTAGAGGTATAKTIKKAGKQTAKTARKAKAKKPRKRVKATA